MNPHDPEARITKRKDGRTHLAYKAEQAVALNTGAVVALTVQPADRGDTESWRATLAEAASVVTGMAGQAAQPEAAGPVKKVSELGVEWVVADKGYHSKQVLEELAEVGVRTLIAEPERKRQRWAAQRAAQAAVYANRRRLESRTAKALMRRRGERIERGFAHLYETGGMRRVHLRGKKNIAKRLLIHAAAFNLSLILRRLHGVGTARQAAELLTALCLCFLRLMHAANRGAVVVGPRWRTVRTVNLRCHHPSPHRQDVALSTGCYANQHRPWQLFETVFHRFYERCRAEAACHGRRKFRFRHKLLSLDATMIPLCLSVFDWALYRRSKGAVKLHLVLDHDGWLLQFAVVTAGKTAEIEVARRQRFEPGTMLVFDRGYTDVAWWLELSRQKVFFVTRLKDNIEYGVVQQRAVRPEAGIVRDEVVLLVRIQEEGPVALMRRIEVWVEDKQEMIVLLTNHLKLAAATVAAVYRERWQIEQFFRALKQSLRIKTFVGTSANAVLVQIWTALIAMLLVRWLQMRSTYGWSLSNLVTLLRQQLFVYRDLMRWLNHPFESPPELYAAEQLALEWA